MKISRRSIIAKHGLSDAEFAILDAINLHGNLAGNRVAKYAVFLGSADPEHSFTLSEYEATVEDCMGKGWLKVLTYADCEQDRLRWQNDLNQSFSEFEYKPGDIDFTEDGARLFYGIHVALDVAESKRPYHSMLGLAWNVPSQVRVFGAYADELQQAVEAYVTGKYLLSTDPITIEYVEGPFPIGPFWLSRFVQLLVGYHSVINYTSETGIAAYLYEDKRQ